MTLTFDIGGHGACGCMMQIISSIRIPSLKFVGLVIRKMSFTRCVSALMGLVTLTFDNLTLKLVCESHLRWGTFLPNLGRLGLWVVELFAMYNLRDGRTDKSNAYCPIPKRAVQREAGHNNTL